MTLHVVGIVLSFMAAMAVISLEKYFVRMKGVYVVVAFICLLGGIVYLLIALQETDIQQVGYSTLSVAYFLCAAMLFFDLRKKRDKE